MKKKKNTIKIEVDTVLFYICINTLYIIFMKKIQTQKADIRLIDTLKGKEIPISDLQDIIRKYSLG